MKNKIHIVAFVALTILAGFLVYLFTYNGMGKANFINETDTKSQSKFLEESKDDRTLREQRERAEGLAMLEEVVIVSGPEIPFVKIGQATFGPAGDIYEGQVILSGRYYYTNSPNAHGGEQLCFEVDESSVQKTPDKRNRFCFRNLNQAKRLFKVESIEANFDVQQYCEITGNATIWIKNYFLLRAEIGGTDVTKIARVITDNGKNFSCRVPM